MASGKVPEACAAFEASQKLEPAVTTLLNLGGCRERNGQFATAWGIFVDVQRNLRDVFDEDSKQLADVARTRADALEPRLSKLTIHVAPALQALHVEIARNDEHLAPGAWNTPLPTDGGHYVITARAEGYKTWSGTVTVAPEHDDQSIEVPPLIKAPPQKPAPLTVAAPSKLPVVPIVVGGGAALMLASAVAFDLSGETTYDQAKAEMTNNAVRTSLYNSANTKRYAAEVLAGAGIATAGVAVWLFFRERRRDKEVHPRVLPTVAGDGTIGVVGAF